MEFLPTKHYIKRSRERSKEFSGTGWHIVPKNRYEYKMYMKGKGCVMVATKGNTKAVISTKNHKIITIY